MLGYINQLMIAASAPSTPTAPPDRTDAPVLTSDALADDAAPVDTLDWTAVVSEEPAATVVTIVVVGTPADCMPADWLGTVAIVSVVMMTPPPCPPGGVIAVVMTTTP